MQTFPAPRLVHRIARPILRRQSLTLEAWAVREFGFRSPGTDSQSRSLSRRLPSRNPARPAASTREPKVRCCGATLPTWNEDERVDVRPGETPASAARAAASTAPHISSPADEERSWSEAPVGDVARCLLLVPPAATPASTSVAAPTRERQRGARLPLSADRAASKHLGDSRNRGKAGPPADPTQRARRSMTPRCLRLANTRCLAWARGQPCIRVRRECQPRRGAFARRTRGVASVVLAASR
jgi:hypothetical protein